MNSEINYVGSWKKMRRRHRKDRRERKRQKKIIVFGVIAFACMLSVGYAAFSSEFLISGKGTIIVPEGRLTTEDLKSLVVTNGDGLYADPVETDRYVYKGASPANYITFNGEEAGWRIVSVEADGTIKIVRNSIIDSMAWDADGNRTASGYCQSKYCNAWGSSTTTLDSSGNNVTVMPRTAGSTTTYALPTNEASLNTYLNGAYLNGIGSEYQDVIETHTFNIGPLALTSGQTLATDISQESAYKWEGKVGLINATDYVRASTNASCTGVYAYYDTSGCYDNSSTHNYLFASLGSNYPWTMSPYSGSSYLAFYVISEGYIDGFNVTDSNNGVAPVLYLKSDITLTGSGSSGDPFVLSGI